MTRKQEIRQASFTQESVCTTKEMKCFVWGAEWADKTMIDKACKWLEQNADKYLYNTGGYEEYIPKCGDKLFYDFKKAMEE